MKGVLQEDNPLPYVHLGYMYTIQDVSCLGPLFISQKGEPLTMSGSRYGGSSPFLYYLVGHSFECLPSNITVLQHKTQKGAIHFLVMYGIYTVGLFLCFQNLAPGCDVTRCHTHSSYGSTYQLEYAPATMGIRWWGPSWPFGNYMGEGNQVIVMGCGQGRMKLTVKEKWWWAIETGENIKYWDSKKKK